MGQLQPKPVEDKRPKVKGGIMIQIDKTMFVSDEIIQGTLNIQLEEAFSGHFLDLTIEGKEEIHWLIIHSKHRHSGYGYNTLINFSIPLYDFCLGGGGGSQFKLQPGQWSIPFSIKVDSIFPSSLQLVKDAENRCSLAYRLVANIISTDENIQPVSGYQDILICQYIVSDLNPHLSLDIKPIECCLGKIEQFTLKATLNQTVFVLDEAIEVSLNCDLSGYSNKVISFLKVSLIGKVQYDGPSILYKQSIEILNISNQVPVKSKHVNEISIITIPPKTFITVIGKYIKLNYFISVTAEIDNSSCMLENNPLIIPIIIYPSQKSMMQMNLPQLNQNQAPTYWNPQQLKQREFTERQLFEYQQEQLQNKSNIEKMAISNQEQSYLIQGPDMSQAQINRLL